MDSGSASVTGFSVSLSNHVGFTPWLLYKSTPHSPENFIHLKTVWAQDAWLQWSNENWYFYLDISCWYTIILLNRLQSSAFGTPSRNMKRGQKYFGLKKCFASIASRLAFQSYGELILLKKDPLNLFFVKINIGIAFLPMWVSCLIVLFSGQTRREIQKGDRYKENKGSEKKGRRKEKKDAASNLQH